MSSKKSRSDVVDAILSTVKGMHQDGIISDARLQEYIDMADNAKTPQEEWQATITKGTPFANYNSRKIFPLWHNPTNPKSLRLSHDGFGILENVKTVKFYKFKLEKDILPKTLVQLERYFTEPYYIMNNKTIIVAGDKEAMMLTLHASNLQAYLDNNTR